MKKISKSIMIKKESDIFVTEGRVLTITNNSHVFSDNNFLGHNCDIETKFAKFYKVKSDAGRLSIIKVFKEKYADFFSSHKYRLLQQLDSSLMVAIEYVKEEPNPYVQYEYFESMPLKEWLTANQCISKDTLLSVLADMAEIVDYFHENNLVHLDIIGNFLVGAGGKVKLNDYDYVEELNGSGKHKIDLHSFFELVYRLIYFLNKKISTRTIQLTFDDSQPDYSSCKNFLNNLNIN